MGILRAIIQNRLNNQAMQNPTAKSFVDSINAWGTYDEYNSASRRKAEEAYDRIDRYTGSLNPQRTSQLYWDIVRTTSLPVSLAAAYAFTVVNHIETGMYFSSSDREAREKAGGVRVLFPLFGAFVDGRHNPSEAMAVLCVASNYFDCFL